MDEDYDRMYIGSKDHILSLDLHDINKDPHIVRSPTTDGIRLNPTTVSPSGCNVLFPNPFQIAENEFILESMFSSVGSL